MGKRLFVGNMSFSHDEEDLETVFGEYGEVASAAVIRDRESNRHQGFGFVEFTSDESAGEAMSKLNGQEVMGRTLRVDEAKERASRPRADGFNDRRW